MTKLQKQLADLECVIQELSNRLSALTDAVDALFDEVQWRNNNTADSENPPYRLVLTSLPIDPCSDDWQVNRTDRSGEPVASKSGDQPGTQGALFR